MRSDFQAQEAIRYFLGELSETEQAAVEEKFFMDAEFSEWLDEVETDLIDSYVLGELDATEKRKFEEKFLVSERRRERVKAAVMLKNELLAQPSGAGETATKVSFWESLKEFFRIQQYGLAYAAGLVLLLFLLGGILLLRQGSQNEIVKRGNENINVEPPRAPSPENSPTISPNSNVTLQISNENANVPNTAPKQSVTPQPAQTPQTAPPRPPQAPQPVVAFFSLFPSVRSGGEIQKLSLKSSAQTVQMRLARETGEEFARYRVELRDEKGAIVFSQNLAAKKSLISTFPARILRGGRYELTLLGAKAGEDFQDLSFYNFSVEKK